MTALTTARTDLRDIQGNILRSYHFPVAAHLFVHVEDADRGRGWLDTLGSRVTNAGWWDEKPGATLNIALTASGLRALGVPEPILDSFPEEYLQGMAARAEVLGDTGASAPHTWEGGLGTGEVHVMVALQARSAETLQRRVQEVEASMRAGGGLRVVSRQDAARLPGGREHFGFVDGLGQPWVEGPDSGRVFRGQGTPDGRHGWRPVALGEFLLGHTDEEGSLPDAPTPDVLAHNGTFLIYRRLRQDVAGFRRLLRDQAVHLGGDEELVGAKIVGRWTDGSPLELSPDRPDPGLGRDRQRNNDFRYGQDGVGERCPIGAHIRRANPRDALGFNEQMVSRHRLIRRGIAYGPPLPEGVRDDDGTDRGLLFIAAMASISRQFEFVQSQWLNDGNIFDLGTDRDVITGDQGVTSKMTVQGSPPRFLWPLPRLTVTRGGEYLFMPGITALEWLAQGRFDAS
jgi:Dyp-type peroxidase family